MKTLTQLKKGTSRILYSRDVGTAAAFNRAVDAIRELQHAVTELQEEVDRLRKERAG